MAAILKQLKITYFDKTITNISGARITKLGIQAEPGAEFQLNIVNNSNDSDSIIIGKTGIYEIELSNTTINSVQCVKAPSLPTSQTEVNANTYFYIIDYVDNIIEGGNN